MEEIVICESRLNKKFKRLFIIPAIFMCIAISTGEPFDMTWYPGWCMFFAAIIGALVFALHSCHMVVTDKRVYGTAIFRRKIVLPLDMISATSTGLFGSVAVSTASGVIRFCFLENGEEVCSSIVNLLMQRQENKNGSEKLANTTTRDEVDQLKKYKELLDCGTITQEEFETKKKKLLGL